MELAEVDSSTVICWTSPFVILGVSSVFCRYYFIFDGTSSTYLIIFTLARSKRINSVKCTEMYRTATVHMIS